MARYGMNNNGDTFVTVDSKEVGEAGFGCFKFLLIIFIIGFIAKAANWINEKINLVGDFMLVKLLLFPSLWDYFIPRLKDSDLFVFISMLVTIFIISKAYKIVKTKPKPNKILIKYLDLNFYIVALRLVVLVVGGISNGVMALF